MKNNHLSLLLPEQDLTVTMPLPVNKHFQTFIKAILKLRKKPIQMTWMTLQASRNKVQSCAKGFLRGIYPMNKLKKNTQYNILILNKGGLDQDVLTSIGDDDRFQIYSARRTDLHSIYRAFLFHHQTDYFYKSQDPEIYSLKIQYRSFLKEVWKIVHKKIPIDMVITANIVYHAEQELAGLLHEIGTPFIVIHKECLKSPETSIRFEQYYKRGVEPFKGEHVFVYNNIEKQQQINSNLIDNNKISVVGMPRLDPIHRWRKNNKLVKNTHPIILFFLFDKNVSLGKVIADSKSESAIQKGWEELSKKTALAVLKTAKKYPNAQIIVKSKGYKGGIAEITHTFFKTNQLPSNMSIIVGGDPLHLITRADVICGFNSTALLEALASGIPTVVPHFNEAADPAYKKNRIDLGEAVIYANSAEELPNVLYHTATKMQASEKLTDIQKKMLDHWVGNSDGQSSQRIQSGIISILTETSTLNSK